MSYLRSACGAWGVNKAMLAKGVLLVLQAYAHGHERLESLILKLSNDRAPRLPNGRVSLSLTQRPASPGASNMTQVCRSFFYRTLPWYHAVRIPAELIVIVWIGVVVCGHSSVSILASTHNEADNHHEVSIRQSSAANKYLHSHS